MRATASSSFKLGPRNIPEMRTKSLAQLMQRSGAAPDAITRRRFLQATLAAGAALMIPRRSPSAAVASTQPRIVVIGAGFAGLSCAYQLRRTGANVQVLEARNRVGGRVMSLDNFVPGKVIEAGAELIGRNHPTWMAYAKEFGLAMRDVSEDPDHTSPILIGGKTYANKEAEKLWEQIEKALALMNADASRVDLERPWLTPDAQHLDQRSFSKLIESWPLDSQIKEAATALMANDNVFNPANVSYLGILSTIAGGGIEAFWSESEVYRCAAGNQALALKLANAIGTERINLSTPIEKLEIGANGVRITTTRGQIHEADVVVLTAPPSTWNRMVFDPALPSGLMPYAGPAIKYLTAVDKAFWTSDGLGPDALTDTPIGETWHATDGQRDSSQAPACFTVFSGGDAAERCLQLPRPQRDLQMTAWIEKIYPSYGTAARRRMFMGWPEDRWTSCGYTSPSLGEVTGIYPRLAQGVHDKIFFAGEYSSLLFTGFMEGGLHSGAILAKQLVARLNLN